MAEHRQLNPPGAGHPVALRLSALVADQPCGDAAASLALPAGQLLVIIDGLGHGPEAALAAQAALHTVAAQPGLPLPQLLALLDQRLAATRGAAIGLARIQGRRLLYAGVGNTRALRWRGDRILRLSSQYGIVGGGLQGAVQLTDIDLQPGDWLMLFTDGLNEMLQLPVRLPEWQRDPGLLCEHLLARWRNPDDDAGVLVCCVEDA